MSNRLLPLSSILGAVVWLIALAIVPLRLESAILLFAPLVLVPLGIALVPRPADRASQLLVRAIRMGQLPAAVSLVVAFTQPPGMVAATLAAPWLSIVFLLAAWGCMRLVRGERSLAALALNAGLMLPSVAGVWIVLFHYGRWPLGYSPQIVELTGVHFHYTGFVLPLLLYRAARAWPGKVMHLAVACSLVAIPVVALGITFSRATEALGADLLTAGCALLACSQLRLAFETDIPAVRTLLSVSGLSLLGGMSLAVLYALGRAMGEEWIDIATMIPTHGIANAFGFALPGLLGWRIADVRRRLSCDKRQLADVAASRCA